MKKTRAPYLMLAPYFLLYFAFSVFPIVFSLVISFMKWDGVSQANAFVGVANYIRVFTKDKFFWKSLGNTLLMTVAIIPLELVLGLLAATLLKDYFKRTRGVFQLFNFLPYLTTSVAISIIFQMLFNWKSGIVNAGLGFFGVEPIYWLGEGWASRVVVIVMEVWKRYGYMMVMFMAGLSTIPEELYESARMDGARWKHQFWHITLPMLKPIFTFALITGTINGLNLFDGPQLLFSGTRQPMGGPDHAVMTVVMRFYEASFQGFEFGYGSAIAFCLFIIISVISFVMAKSLNGGGDAA